MRITILQRTQALVLRGVLKKSQFTLPNPPFDLRQKKNPILRLDPRSRPLGSGVTTQRHKTSLGQFVLGGGGVRNDGSIVMGAHWNTSKYIKIQ